MFLQYRKKTFTQLNLYIMPKLDVTEPSKVRDRYFKNLVSCVSSASSLLDNGEFVSFCELFGYAAWYLDKIKQLDFQLGCVAVDSNNNPEK